jgi:hypothetical protein
MTIAIRKKEVVITFTFFDPMNAFQHAMNEYEGNFFINVKAFKGKGCYLTNCISLKSFLKVVPHGFTQGCLCLEHHCL